MPARVDLYKFTPTRLTARLSEDRHRGASGVLPNSGHPHVIDYLLREKESVLAWCVAAFILRLPEAACPVILEREHI
jgi:hypothetical protein